MLVVQPRQLTECILASNTKLLATKKNLTMKGAKKKKHPKKKHPSRMRPPLNIPVKKLELPPLKTSVPSRWKITTRIAAQKREK